MLKGLEMALAKLPSSWAFPQEARWRRLRQQPLARA